MSPALCHFVWAAGPKGDPFLGCTVWAAENVKRRFFRSGVASPQSACLNLIGIVGW